MSVTTIMVRNNMTLSSCDDVVNNKQQDHLEEIMYPSVPATLILDEVNTDTNATSPSIPEASYASAHILLDKADSDENDDVDDEAVMESRHRATDDTTTWITALALDPWDKEPTVSSTLGASSSNSTDPSNSTALLLSYLLSSSAQLSAHASELSTPQPVAIGTIVVNPAEHYTATDGAGESLVVKKMRRRRRRRVRMMLAGVTGFVAGGAILGPLGAYMGAAGGAALAHRASKRGERRKDRRLVKRTEQRQLLMQQLQQQQRQQQQRQQEQSENNPDASSTLQPQQQQEQQPPQPTLPQSGPLPQATAH